MSVHNQDLLYVELPDASTADDFLKVRETLTRIGHPGKGKRLYQTCYLYHSRGRYAICHHKELKSMFGEDHEEMTDHDYDVRDMAAYLLQQWNLLRVIDEEDVEDLEGIKLKDLRILKFSEKAEWDLVPTFTFKSRERSLEDA